MVLEALAIAVSDVSGVCLGQRRGDEADSREGDDRGVGVVLRGVGIGGVDLFGVDSRGIGAQGNIIYFRREIGGRLQ